jgi:ankyrin repeat protein
MQRLVTGSICVAVVIGVGLSAGFVTQDAPTPPVKGDPTATPAPPEVPTAKPTASKVPTVKPLPRPSSKPSSTPTPNANPGRRLPPGLIRPGAPGAPFVGPAAPPVPQVIVAEPASVDLGEFSTSETKAGKLLLRNTGDSPVTIRSAKASCGCTTADFKRNTVLEPGESTEVTIRMKGGPSARVLNKTVTFTIDGHPQLKVPVKGRSILYVNMLPKQIGTELNPDGKIVLESIDGQPFRITTVNPPVVNGLTDEKKVKHELVIDWDQFFDVAKNARLTFFYDHPLCDQYYSIVKLTRAQRTALNEKIRGQQGFKPGKDGALTPSLSPTGKPLPSVIRNNSVVSMVTAGNIEGVKQRLAAGDNVNATDNTGQSLLSIAAKDGNVELITVLLDADAEIDSRDRVARTPLMHAGTSHNPEAIRLLIERGADVNTRDSFIGGPLAWTAGFGDAESVRDLLDAGAQVETVGGATGYTPLIWAAGFGDAESVPLLLEAGANIEARGSIEGNTALMHAAKTGKLPAIKALIARKASLEAKNNMGQTALLVSAGHPAGSVDKLTVLLDAGADITVIDNNGRSVLDLARARTDAKAGPVIVLLEGRMPSK